MKILLFSDLHAHPFKAYSYVNPKGINSRLQDSLDCLNQIYEYVQVHPDISLIFNGGDTFHERKQVDTVTLHLTFEALTNLSKLCPMYTLVGNHDQGTKDGKYYSTSVFSNPLKPLDTIGWTNVKDKYNQELRVFHVPYTEDIPQIKSALNPSNMSYEAILLGHLGVQGAKVGADFVYANKHDPTVEDLKLDRFQAGFLGHYHLHQKIASNSWYIGSPLQHNWGDVGQKRGFCVYDTDTKKLEHISLKYPKFVEIQDGNTVASNLTKNNFIKYYTDLPSSNIDVDELRTLLEAKHVDIISSYVPGIAQTSTKPALNISGSVQDILANYVEATVDDSAFDKAKLIELGKSLIK